MARVLPPAMPPLSFARRRSTVKLPAIDSASVSSERSSSISSGPELKYESHPAPGTTGDLRKLAIESADRRHTVIQLQLAAAHFETKLVSGQNRSDEPEFSKANAWDEFVTAEAKKRASVKKGRRSLKTQLDALSVYMDRRTSLRRGAPMPPILSDMRSSELHRFEILRKQVAPSPRVIADSSPRWRGLPGASLVPRRRSIAFLPPLIVNSQVPAGEKAPAGGARGAGGALGMIARRVSMAPIRSKPADARPTASPPRDRPKRVTT